MDDHGLAKEALNYHAYPRPGKLGTVLTKPTETQYDLSLAYTPGVAEPVRVIANDPKAAYHYTNKANLVAVISNGTAILGLGALGALASKPVMEGKAVLFKRLADIDVFDIEMDCTNPKDFIETVVRIAPTFGGINLEDIKAPECFEIEEALIDRLSIPVFHDDQHGTAIVIAAGLLNALEIQGKEISEINLVCAGAGAAGIASMRLLIKLGADPSRLYMIDRTGVVHQERQDLSRFKREFAVKTHKRSLADALSGSDVFIGVSGPNILTAEMVRSMSAEPIIFALSNPDPEIKPELVKQIYPKAIVATGRSDYVNQVNNALCFPYIFRGALDARATRINDAMKIAAVEAIRHLAKEAVPDEIMQAYPREQAWHFGPEYLLPKLMDGRLRTRVSKAVAEAVDKEGIKQELFF